uniref:Uncharacterized protein n=1 Tax=Fundulus heteroclitus TaxID=8078 RepID=A0A3Q2UIP5_FUNHE
MIVDFWQQHYSKLFTCVKSKPFQADKVSTVETIKTHKVYQAIKELSANKSIGMNLIAAEHLKFASPRVLPLLALCFTGFIMHGFIPKTLMNVLLLPGKNTWIPPAPRVGPRKENVSLNCLGCY